MQLKSYLKVFFLKYVYIYTSKYISTYSICIQHIHTFTLSVGVVTKIVANPDMLPAMKRDFREAVSSGSLVTIGKAAAKLAKHTA